MKQVLILAALGGASLALAGCQNNQEMGNEQANAAHGADAEDAGAYDTEVNAATDGGTASGSATTLPEGSRVVVENGLRYRVDASGTRERITDDQPVIYVDDGVRYRVDPGGTRVRIGPDGVDVDLVGNRVDARVRPGEPSPDANVNSR